MTADIALPLVPKLRFREFRDTGNWQRAQIGELATISKGKGVSKADIADDGAIPCIRYAELYTHYGEVIREPLFYTNVPPDELVLSQTDDVITPASGETREDIARAACVISAGIALGSDLNILRSDLNGRFLSYLLNSPIRYAIARLAQGDTVAHLYPGQLSKVVVAYPTQREQNKIADCLGSLDDLIALEARMLDSLRQHKLGLVQQLFPQPGETVPRRRFDEFVDAPEWKPTSIGEHVDLLSGYAFDGNDIVENSTGTSLMRGINITEGRIRHHPDFDRYYLGPTNDLKKYVLREGDLVIGMDGSKVGKNSAVVSAQDAGSLLVQRVARLRSDRQEITDFIFHYVNSTKFHAYVDRVNTSSGIPHISAKQINAFPFSLPTTDEQKRITNCLVALDERITAQIQELEVLKRHKQGLLQQLFPSLEGTEH